MPKKKRRSGLPAPEGYVQVESKAYGTHFRLKRGTHKPAKLNDSFKAASASMLGSANPARLIKNAIDVHRKSVYDGSFWSRLISHFFAHKRSDGLVDFTTLQGFELHREHPLRRIVDFEIMTNADLSSARLEVRLDRINFLFHNVLPGIDSALLTPVVLFINSYGTASEAQSPGAFPMSLEDKKLQFDMTIPPYTECVLICIKCEGNIDNVMSANARSKGMQIVKAIALDAVAEEDAVTPTSVSINNAQMVHGTQVAENLSEEHETDTAHYTDDSGIPAHDAGTGDNESTADNGTESIGTVDPVEKRTSDKSAGDKRTGDKSLVESTIVQGTTDKGTIENGTVDKSTVDKRAGSKSTAKKNASEKKSMADNESQTGVNAEEVSPNQLSLW